MNKLSVIFLALGPMVIAGCVPPRTVDTIELSADKPDNWINTDPRLAKVAAVTRVNKARVGDLLHVQVDVENRTSFPHVISYRIIWVDEAGKDVPTPLTAWERKWLDGRQSAALTGVAPDARVSGCRLEMKLADGT